MAWGRLRFHFGLMLACNLEIVTWVKLSKNTHCL